MSYNNTVQLFQDENLLLMSNFTAFPQDSTVVVLLVTVAL